MKKVSFKLVVSAIAASMMISATAVSASAINYDPWTAPLTPPAPSASTGNTPVASTDNTGSVDSASDSTATKATGVVTKEVVDTALAEAIAAGKTEVTIKVAEDATGKLTVQESAIADIKKSGVTVTFEIKPVAGVSYAVTIDPSKIKSAKAIDLGMVIATGSDLATIATSFGVEGVPASLNAVMIAPIAQGEFGMELAVTLPASAFGSIDKNSAMLFYISDDGSISDVSDLLTFDAKGNGTIAITHASAYLISDDDIAAALAADIGDDDDDDDDDDASIDEDDDTADDEPVVIKPATDDNNPGTGVGLGLGAVVASAAAIIIAKKRK